MNVCVPNSSRTSIPYSRQVALPPVYKNRRLGREYRTDLVVADTAVIEVKAIEQLRPVHDAQLLTYFRLSRLGLILNFGSVLLKEGTGASCSRSGVMSISVLLIPKIRSGRGDFSQTASFVSSCMLALRAVVSAVAAIRPASVR